MSAILGGLGVSRSFGGFALVSTLNFSRPAENQGFRGVGQGTISAITEHCLSMATENVFFWRRGLTETESAFDAWCCDSGLGGGRCPINSVDGCGPIRNRNRQGETTRYLGSVSCSHGGADRSAMEI